MIAVRISASSDGEVLHFSHFDGATSAVFSENDTVQQIIDADKRLLYSRLHIAGYDYIEQIHDISVEGQKPDMAV